MHPDPNRRASWSLLVSNAGFRRLWFAGWLSLTGSQTSRVAFLLYLLEASESIRVLAALLVLANLPGAIAGLAGGGLLDRVPTKATLVTADVVRFASLGLVLWQPSATTIFLTTAIHSIASAFFYPARMTAIARLVVPDQLNRANALEQAASYLMMIAGPVLGSELFFNVGIRGTVVFDMATYLASALLISGARIPRPSTSTSEAPSSITAELLAGWKHLYGDRLLLQMLGLFSVSLVCAGIWLPVAPLFIQETLEASSRMLGWQLGMFGAGGVAGGFLAVLLAARLGKGPLLFYAFFAEACVMTIYSLVPNLWLSFAICFLWGLSVSALLVPFHTILQTYVSDKFRGRVFVVVRQTENVAILVAMLLASALSGVLSSQGILLLCGVGYVLVVSLSARTPSARVLRARG